MANKSEKTKKSFGLSVKHFFYQVFVHHCFYKFTALFLSVLIWLLIGYSVL